MKAHLLAGQSPLPAARRPPPIARCSTCQRFLWVDERMAVKEGHYYCPECAPAHWGMVRWLIERIPIIGRRFHL